MTLGGCGTGPTPTQTEPGSWRVVGIEPGGSQVGAEGRIPEVAITVTGPAGFVRATVAVERSGLDGSVRKTLYDTLFPVGEWVRLQARVERATPSAEADRVLIRAESNSTTSESLVEPGVPFSRIGGRGQSRTAGEARPTRSGRPGNRGGALGCSDRCRVRPGHRPRPLFPPAHWPPPQTRSETTSLTDAHSENQIQPQGLSAFHPGHSVARFRRQGSKGRDHRVGEGFERCARVGEGNDLGRRLREHQVNRR